MWSIYILGVNLYCRLHKLAKKFIKNEREPFFVDFDASLGDKSQLYPTENIVELQSGKGNHLSCLDTSILRASFKRKKIRPSFLKSLDIKQAKELWMDFIRSSVVTEGYRNQAFHYGGFILEYGNWCLPSWIWTNAALVRFYISVSMVENARLIADLFLKSQEECGGWIVRNDYKGAQEIQQLAPNDSAYIANNACLSMYKNTGEEKYLNSAIKCADWIINTARPDGLVYLGCNYATKEWNKRNNIVDTGFTAGLFANLYKITGEKKYMDFLIAFVNRYIKIFYNSKRKRFYTATVDDKPIGGSFTRGQAWALEGLIPTYEVLKDRKLKCVIEDTVSTVIDKQHSTGGWAYNLDRELMGEDCKGVSVLALNLWRWNKIEPSNAITASCKRALDWCVKHTLSQGKGKGGIYSFSSEGAIVHHLYTNTALVYACAYAYELLTEIEKADL